MLFRCMLSALTLASAAAVSNAGPYRRYQPAPQPTYQPAYQSPTYRYPTQQPVYQSPAYSPSAVVPAGGYVVGSTPVVTPAVEYVSGYTPTVVTGSPVVGFDAGGMAGDGLEEVNAKRAARGLRPFVRDEGLSQAARACASFRAANGLFGHTSNDFGFVPAGTSASSAGCAAYPAGFGWMSCCVYDNYTYAGAAWVTGRDGKRYMHLFVR